MVLKQKSRQCISWRVGRGWDAIRTSYRRSSNSFPRKINAHVSYFQKAHCSTPQNLLLSSGFPSNCKNSQRKSSTYCYSDHTKIHKRNTSLEDKRRNSINQTNGDPSQFWPFYITPIVFEWIFYLWKYKRETSNICLGHSKMKKDVKWEKWRSWKTPLEATRNLTWCKKFLLKGQNRDNGNEDWFSLWMERKLRRSFGAIKGNWVCKNGI